MNVLADKSVWSEALRRRRGGGDRAIRAHLAAIIDEGRIAMIGSIRQELLSGIKDESHFVRLRDYLRAFPDVPLGPADHEEAAAFYNRCRAKGIQGSNTDFLICATAVRHDFAIFSIDADFRRFAAVLPIALLPW